MSCPFCEGNNYLSKQEIRNVGDFNARIKGTEISLVIKTYDGGSFYESSYVEKYIPIVYCPICGDKLHV
jgi:hypothetical protein